MYKKNPSNFVECRSVHLQIDTHTKNYFTDFFSLQLSSMLRSQHSFLACPVKDDHEVSNSSQLKSEHVYISADQEMLK